jgi:hypothetical protein
VLRVGGVGGVAKNRQSGFWLVDAVRVETISSSVDGSGSIIGECMMACILDLLGTAITSGFSLVPFVIGIQRSLT